MTEDDIDETRTVVERIVDGLDPETIELIQELRGAVTADVETVADVAGVPDYRGARQSSRRCSSTRRR